MKTNPLENIIQITPEEQKAIDKGVEALRNIAKRIEGKTGENIQIQYDLKPDYYNKSAVEHWTVTRSGKAVRLWSYFAIDLQTGLNRAYKIKK